MAKPIKIMKMKNSATGSAPSHVLLTNETRQSTRRPDCLVIDELRRLFGYAVDNRKQLAGGQIEKYADGFSLGF